MKRIRIGIFCNLLLGLHLMNPDKSSHYDVFIIEILKIYN